MQIVPIFLLKILKKRSFKKLLFLFLSFPLLCMPVYSNEDLSLKNALENNLFLDPTWLSLLHLHQRHPDIEDNNFYLNKKFTSAKEEFVTAYNAFFVEKDKNKICRFPARYFWMQTRLKLEQAEKLECKELQEFVKNAPLDKASVIFASENLSVPTSMMGHIFLKISGKNDKNDNVDHSISFFTNVDQYSFPALAFKSLLTGMKGQYALGPYQSQRNAYLFNEQRNIWEYELKLTPEQKTLLQYHLLELKNISFTYFFHGFNCATLINNIVAVAHPEIANDRSFWVTPLDVARSINNHQIAETTLVTPSSKWKIQSLLDSINLSSENLNLIKERDYKNLKVDSLAQDEQFLTLELARGYNNYLSEEEIISRDEWKNYENYLSVRKNAILKDAVLDTSNYKKPHLTIQDSQFISGFKRQNKKDLLLIGFLPASHDLLDDTSNYSNESSLKLGEVIASYQLKENKMRVDSAILYSAFILRPHNSLIGGMSGQFSFGYSPFLDKNFALRGFYTATGGIGKTFRLHRDLDFFVLGNGTVRSGQKTFLNASPQAGLVIREIWNMKSLFSYSHHFSPSGNWSNLEELEAAQAINLGSFSFNFSWRGFRKENNKSDEYKFLLKYLF